MLKVWGRRSAFNVQKVMWLIGELGLEHEHIDAGGSAGGLDEPEFVAMNPHGRVPVIDDDGTIVWESHTILRYLAARYGAGTFWADDPATRAQAEQWMDWSQTSLQPAFMDLFWGYYRTPEAERDTARVERASAQCVEDYRLLESQLNDRFFLAGDGLSLADIPAATSLHRYLALDLPRPDLPLIEAWYARLAERPAYRDHIMLDFSDLKGRLAF